MSAIGNYIHYYKRNYFSYGTDRTEGERIYDKTNIGQIIIDKRRSLGEAFQIKQQDSFKEKYQKALNYLYGMSKVSPKSLETKIEKEIMTEFYNILEKQFPGTIIDFASMSAKEAAQGLEKLKKVNTSKAFVSFGSLNAKLQTLYVLFNQRGNELKDRYSEKEVEEKYQLYMKVVNTVMNFYKEAIAQEGQSDSPYIKLAKEKISSGFGIDLAKASSQHLSMIDDLNQVISFMNGKTKSQVNGELGEIGAAMAGALMAGKAKSELKSFLEQSIIGMQSSYSTYAKINFSDDFVEMEKLASKGWRYDGPTGNVLATKPTQDKIDVIVKTKGGSKYLSVKNYNFKKGSAELSLVSGISLLNLIQNENQDDFINHYLNITSSRKKEKTETTAHLKEYKVKMHDVMKELILVKALTGLNIQKTMKNGSAKNKTAADYFVINDNSDQTTPFKIFSMAEILNFSSLDNQSGLSKYASIDGYDEPEWENEGGDAKSRITSLIMQLHQKKLHAFASVKAFPNMV